ncbi:MAG: alpha/beta fold hydrolase [Actinomycetota bacterium]
MSQVVLIHGGSFTSRYFDRLGPLLDRPHLAVDLPGRGARPADVNNLTIADWIDAVVEDVERAGFDRVVLHGHSLAGVTMPGVAARLPDLVHHLVFSSCTVPGEGQRACDLLRPDIADVVRSVRGVVESGQLRLGAEIPDVVDAREMVGADAPEPMLEFVRDPARRHHPEAISVLFEPIS